MHDTLQGMSTTPSLGHLASPLIQIPSNQMVIRRYRPLSERNIRTYFENGPFCRQVPTFCDDNEGLVENPAGNDALRAGAVATANSMRRRRDLPELKITKAEFIEGMEEFHHQARHKHFANCWRLGTPELDKIWKRYTGDEDMVEGFAFETTVGQFIAALPTRPDDIDPEDEEVDEYRFEETPVTEMYVGHPRTDIRIGAVQYQVRQLPETIQPTGYQAAINFFKGSGFDHELEFRLLINPFDSANLLRFDMDAKPVGCRPDLDQNYRYFPMDTITMTNRIVLAPNAGAEQRQQIEEVLDEVGVTYGPGGDTDLTIVEANDVGDPLHQTHPYAAEFDGTDNYEGDPEYLNQIRESFVETSDPETWPVLDLIELYREQAAMVIEGYRHPTKSPTIDMEKYGHDGFQAVVVNRTSANGGTDQYLNQCAEERFGTDNGETDGTCMD